MKFTNKHFRKVMIIDTVTMTSHLNDMFEIEEDNAIKFINNQDYQSASQVLMNLVKADSTFSALTTNGVQFWRNHPYMAKSIFTQNPDITEIYFESEKETLHLLAEKKDFSE